MTIPLKHLTDSQEIPLGYFLDSTDGNTEETGLTIANTDIKLWKRGATTLVNKNSGGATHISNGVYYCVLNGVDTNTLGSLIVFVHVSGALAVRVECEVMIDNRYNSLVAGTDKLQVDVTQLAGVTQSLTDLKDFADTGYDPATNKVQGVVLTDTCTTNTDMVGTANAALAATALSDATWTNAKAAYLDHSIATVDTVADGIQTDLSNATDGLGALKALIDTIDGIVDNILTDTGTTLDGKLNTIDTVADGIQTDLSNATDGLGALKALIDTVDGVVDTILVDTNDLQTNQGAWATATGFSTHSAANVWAVAARTLTANTNFNDLDAAAIKAEVVAALADIKLDHLINIAVDTNWATTVHLDSVIGHLADVGTAATFDRTTDALEAIRNRGDGAWVTATGFNTTTPPTVGEIRTEMEGAGTKLLAIEGYTDKIDDATNGLTAIKAEVEGLAGAAMRGTDGANTTVPDAAGVAPTVGEIRTEMEGAGSKILAIEGDTNELQTNQGAWATAVGFSTHAAADVKTAIEAAGSTLAQILEDTGTSLPADIAAVSDYLLGAEIATVTDQTHITLATGSDVDDAYKDQTIVLYDDTNSDFPSVRKITAYTGATKAVTIDSAADFTVGTDDSVRIYITAPGTTAPTAVENAIAVWDRILTGATHNIATSAGRRVREIGAYAIDGGTAQAGNGFSITLAATASGDDGVYNRNLIVLTDNTGAGQTRTIVDYDATSKVCVVDREWRVSPDATTAYQIVPDDTPLTVDHGRARGGTSTTITLRTYASGVDDTYLCNQIGIIAGPGRGQSRLVGAYNGTTKVVTICGDPWVTTPTTDSIYVMMPYGTTCTSCIGSHALEQIKSEADDALSDVNLHKHNETMTALMMSQY